MRKDAFTSLPNQVFFLQKAIEQPVKTALYRVLLDPRALQDSFKVKIPLEDDEPIEDWR